MGSAYQSAMSMLNFYINRAGRNLSAAKKRVLTRAKEELKKDQGKEQSQQKEKEKGREKMKEKNRKR